MKRLKYLILSLVFLFLISVTPCRAKGTHIYSTWDVLELDSCASAWLIKNFIDKEAEFKFYPKGEIITEGIAFDTPDAKIKRTQKKSAFENMLAEYKIKNPALERIGRMIHAVEINFWAGERDVATERLKEQIDLIVKHNKDLQETFKQSFVVMDELYQSLTSTAK